MSKKIFLGAVAGLLSGFLSLGVAYFAGVVTIAVHLREFFPALLAATTVLPLMLLFVLLIPTLVIAVLVGMAIGITAHFTSRVYFAGAVAGLLFGVATLSGVLPLIVVPEPGDFTSIISRPVLAAIYALILGLMAARIFRWFSKT